MAKDKKSRAGALRFIVLSMPGAATVQEGVDPALADACFAEVGAF
jgi:3-dehydroquinate synthase